MDANDRYIQLREACISTYKSVFKDSIAFDINEVPKEMRVILLADSEYLSKTKAAKGLFFKKQLDALQGVIDDDYGQEDKPTSPGDIMKAIDMRNKILFSDMNIDADESNSLNITMQMYTREEMEKMETVTAFTQGSNHVSLAEEEKPKIKAQAKPDEVQAILEKEIAETLGTETKTTEEQAEEIEW